MTDQSTHEAISQTKTTPKETESQNPKNSLTNKALRAILALAIALLSFFVLADVASSPETYAGTIETLDEKKVNVTALAAASTGASIAFSALPENIGAPVANELADLSSDFTIIIAAILLEKYLLTILGLAAFKALIPIACLLYVAGVFIPSFNAIANRYAIKIALFAVILVAIVPASTALSNSIDSTFANSAEEAVLAATSLEEAPAEDEEATEESKFDLIAFVKNIPDAATSAVSDAATAAVSKATNAMNRLMEAFAVMVITSCVIPVLVLMFSLWLVNLLLGVDISAPMSNIKSRNWRKPMAAGRKQLIDTSAKASDKPEC